ncbi:hypothetical protein GCM10009557_36120 [Virgisporangium ochraceum]|uniref:Nucleotidyltransferase n=1 Tax=Virgisporangium ochraceum TaxID=65505 RepID=A0A8J4EAP8_9ACTN|nr:nucleotidyltransferase [Virgisporangium ochraceum]GIJ67916.1 hypothetical protein Voc01_028330 [Virgisporangium ochraceum]
MKVDEAFDTIDERISPTSSQAATAAKRVAHFTEILEGLGPGVKVVPSGSWARGTSLGPIHDVDLIVVFPADQQPTWGNGSGTAQEALDHVQQAIKSHLSERYGFSYVWDTEPRNHVVKCRLDGKFVIDEILFPGFAVEVMPAIRDGSALRVPEAHDRQWATVDPEYLIAETARRQREWPHYTALVRLLKHWAKEHPELGFSSLAMEVLALKCIPRPPLFGSMSRAEALRGFFTAAAAQIMKGVRDPSGRCGEIEPGIKRRKARGEFLKMADLAANAVEWEKSGHEFGDDIAIHFLRKIFGKRFPRPSRDWSDYLIDLWWAEMHRTGPEFRDAPHDWNQRFQHSEGPHEAREPPPGQGRTGGDSPDEGPQGPRGGPEDGPKWGPNGGPTDRPGGGFPGANPAGPWSSGAPRNPTRPTEGGPQSGGRGHREAGQPRVSSVARSGGVSLGNPGGHRKGVPTASPVYAPAAPRPDDPAG